jgi:hypothetical protein
MSKIFGIGLSKTGTTSLHKALLQLNYKSIHFPVSNHDIDKCDAAVNLTIASQYKELDSQYPGSKFILTERNVNSWLASCGPQYRHDPDFDLDVSSCNLDKVKKFYLDLRVKVFGTLYFDEAKFRKAYEDHIRDVKAYFSDREEDLLIINITEGDGWEKLCDFLGKESPDEPFYFSNKNMEEVCALNDDMISRMKQSNFEALISSE